MVWQNSVFPLLIIPAGVPGTGLYVYNGPPALGNPPIAYIASPGVTHDPYGNPLPEPGGGVVSNNPGVSFSALSGGTVLMGLTGATPSILDASIGVALEGAGQAVNVASGTVAGSAGSTLNLGDSKVTSGIGFGPGLQVNDGGDGLTYDTERLSLVLNADTPVGASATVPLFSKTIATGRVYEFDGIIKGVQGAAAVGQIVQFAGPTVSFNDIFIRQNAVGNTSVTDSDLGGGFPVSTTSPAWNPGTVFYTRFRGFIKVSAGAAFTVSAVGNPGGAWTAKAGSMFTLYPVVAV